MVFESQTDPPSLVDLLQHRALHQPNRPAYTFLLNGENDAAGQTYAALDLQARKIAAWLQTHQVGNAPILLVFPPGLDYIAALFGCWYAGAIAVPAYPPRRNRSSTRLKRLVDDAQPALVLSDDQTRRLAQHRLDPNHRLARLPWHTLTEIITHPTLSITAWQTPSLNADSLALLQYTSGTTADPKGVMLTHGNILHHAGLIQETLNLTAESRGVFWVPPYHDMGLIGGLIQPLYVGGQAVLMSPFHFLQKPVRWLRAISRYQATISCAPNSAYDLCLSQISPQERAGLDLSYWQAALNGAEPIRAETMAQFADTFAGAGFRRSAFFPCYGLAEATLLVSGRFWTETDDEPIVCGPPLEDADLIIVDPQTATECAPGQVGEIWLAGRSVAQGYWQRPEQTETTFRAYRGDTGAGPFLRTGDLGYMAQGELVVTGRIKDLIIIQGQNHYPQDIELTVAQSHPALPANSGAAFAVPHQGQEGLVIVHEVQRTAIKRLDGPAVIQAIRQRVSEAHGLAVHAVQLVKPAAIPRTTSGKVQRHLCREQFLAGSLKSVVEWQEPENEPAQSETLPPTKAVKASLRTAETIQRWLIHQVAAQVNLPPTTIDPDAVLATYGFSSQALVALSGALEAYTGQRLSPTIAYTHPTIAALARYLAQNDSNDEGDKEAPASRSLLPAPQSTETIAIIGLGCRFPGAHSPADFWQLLRTGVDAVTAWPADRAAWPGFENQGAGGYLPQIDQFDADFFGISPREAAHMDPQQRLLLEVAWEALEDAGLESAYLNHTATGVFIGISGNDYTLAQLNRPDQPDAYLATGGALSMAANRLSYCLNLRGPSMAVDTACSSSLVALHLACQSLQRGESGMALVGGVNLILSSRLSHSFTQAGFLAADARCKAFAAAADGYVRSEGAGVVVLKPLAQALADGDPVYAVIRGSAINQDGQSNGLTAPQPAAQERVIRAACREAGIEPAHVQYVEAHGTGTPLGDPIEIQALSAALGNQLPTDKQGKPCLIGSVKTNIGHLEAAAGIAGLIKVALMLKHGEIPPSLHFEQPNPRIPFADLPLHVQTRLIPWPATEQPRLAGVSSFGFGGTNAHIILQGATDTPPRPKSAPQSCYLLPLSAHNPAALQALATRYHDLLTTTPPEDLPDLCISAATRRAHHSQRLVAVGETVQALQLSLDKAVSGSASDAIHQPPRLVFVYAGQAIDWIGAGRELLTQSQIFAGTISLCEKYFAPQTGWSILAALRGEMPEAKLKETSVTQPVVFSLQVALTALWRSWGIEPQGVVGHSLGEITAAYCAGVISLEEATRIIVKRSQLMEGTKGQGKLLAVAMSAAAGEQLLADLGGALVVAAINGPQAIVLSGDGSAIAAAQQTLAQANIPHQIISEDYSFHGPGLAALSDSLTQELAELTPQPANLPIASSLTGRLEAGQTFEASYWAANMSRPVRFAAAIDALRVEGSPTTFLEISPHPVLSPALAAQVAEQSGADRVLHSLHRERVEYGEMLRTLGQLYASGHPVDWSGVYPQGGRAVALPTYPWQRQRHWIDPAPVTPQKAANPLDAELQTWLYTPIWQPLPDQAPTPNQPPGAWLVLLDQQGVGEALLTRLVAAGQSVIAVEGGSTYHRVDQTRFVIRPEAAEDVQRLLSACSAEHTLRGIVHLWSLNIPTGLDLADLHQSQRWGCESVLHLAQGLAQGEGTPEPKLWLLTQGAQFSHPKQPLQAPMWGLGRSLAQEQPRNWGGLIDLDPAADIERAAAQLEATLLADTDDADNKEDQIVWRADRRFGLRLIPAQITPNSPPPLSFQVDGAYLISGGLGSLGLQIARWMAEQGARRLILLSRTGLPPRLEWQHLTPADPRYAKVAAIRALETQGVSVQVSPVDVADEGQLDQFLSRYEQEDRPPIRGVVHAAGLLQPGSIIDLTPADLQAALNPKVTGGWNLHTRLQTAPLDFFILFSSAAALLPTPHLGAYAAANAGLDALAHYRQGLGQPALVINWGPWAESSMAAQAENRLANPGLTTIQPAQGLAILNHLGGHNLPQVGVFPLPPDRLRRLYPVDAPLMAHLPATGSQASFGALGVDWANLPGEQQPATLMAHLQAAIAHILRKPAGQIDPERSVLELGLDSIMVMELSHQLAADLGVRLYPHEILSRPTIIGLAEHLAALLKPTSGLVPDAHIQWQDFAPLADPESDPQPSQTDSPNPGIIFILSSPRAGSTLLRVMLAGHPDLFCPPELHLLPFEDLSDRQAGLQTTFLNEGLPRALMALLDLDGEQSRALVSGWEAEGLSTQEVYTWLQSLAHPAMLVDKSPSYGLHLATLNRAEALFDQPRYIHLVRHPYAVIDSFVRRRLDRFFTFSSIPPALPAEITPADNPYVLAEQVWATINRNINTFLSEIDPARQLQVRYEDLVTVPDTTLQTVCHFLELPFHPALLTPYQGERMTDGLYAASLGVGDPNFLAHDGVDSQLATIWQQIKLPYPLQTETGRLAQHFGYSLPDQPGHSDLNLPTNSTMHSSRHLLSSAQQRLWFLDQYSNHSPAFTIPAGLFRLRGPLDVPALEQSLNHIIHRHAALRTRFVVQHGEPRQVIEPPQPHPVPLIDLAALPQAQQETSIRELVTETFHQPFDLAQSPPLRLKLIRLSGEEHLLLLCLHHIIADGWSLTILFRELAALYPAYLAGQPVLPLPDPEPSTEKTASSASNLSSNFLSDLASDLSSNEEVKNVAYWEAALNNAPPQLALPVDLPPPTQRTFAGKSQTLDLPQNLLDDLITFSQGHNLTPFMVMLTTLNIILYHWTGQDDMVVGTVSANRDHPETKDVIGCLMNFLPLRSKIRPDDTVEELLAQVRETTVAAYAHQDCPFEALVAATNPDRSAGAGRNPLYNVALVWQNFPSSLNLGRQLTINFEPLKTQTAQLDLRFIAQPLATGLHVRCEYSTDIFTGQTIRLLLTAIQEGLQMIMNQPATLIESCAIPPSLQTQAQSVLSQTHPLALTLSATFNAEPLAGPLEFWADKLDIPVNITFAPYNQVFQQLLEPGSLILTNQQGMNLVVINLEDWLPQLNDKGGRNLQRTVNEFIIALLAINQRTIRPLIVCLCPPSPAIQAKPALATLLQTYEAQITAELSPVSNISLITGEALNTCYPVADYYDAVSNRLGHIPYKSEYFAALGTMIMRKIHALSRPPYKVIVLDCDYTLWQGVCGEDGPDGITIDPAREALQTFLVEQTKAGMLLCLCSRNNTDDVWDTFAQHPDMPLKRDHLIAWRINWQPKSENLQSLAEELQLSLDSFIFIDDDPLVCAEVESRCPEVLTLQLPSDSEKIPHFLRHVWAFDHEVLTEEDKMRNNFYRQNLKREAFRNKTPTLTHFLAGLELDVQIEPIVPAQFERAVQLSQRANQFNLNPHHLSRHEVSTYCALDNFIALTVQVKDRFGDYGMVGLMIAKPAADRLQVNTYLLSCRALGREVEHHMLATLGQIAHDLGLAYIEFDYTATQQNQPAIDFLKTVGGDHVRYDGGRQKYRLGTPMALAIKPPESLVPQL